MKVFDLGKNDPVWKVYQGLAADSEDAVRNFNRGAQRFRASEVADCRRKLYYRLGGFIPQPKPPWLELVADSGNIHHDYARQIGNHYGMGITGFTVEADGTQVEDRFASKVFEYDGTSFEMSCRADGYIPIEIPEVGTKNAVLEIKSMGQYPFQQAEGAFKKGPEALMALILKEHQNYC